MIDPRAAIDTTAFTFAPNGDQIRSGWKSEIAPDVTILAFANVDLGTERPTRIGRGSRIDHYVHVGHDVQIADKVTVCAGAILCGFVEVEFNAYIGAGARVKQRVRIGRNAMIGLGAVVIRDVPPNCVVVGNPARFLKYRFPNEPESKDWKWRDGKWA